MNFGGNLQKKYESLFGYSWKKKKNISSNMGLS